MANKQPMPHVGGVNYKPDSHYKDLWWEKKVWLGMSRSELVLVAVTFVLGALVIYTVLSNPDWVLGIRHFRHLRH